MLRVGFFNLFIIIYFLFLHHLSSHTIFKAWRDEMHVRGGGGVDVSADIEAFFSFLHLWMLFIETEDIASEFVSRCRSAALLYLEPRDELRAASVSALNALSQVHVSK